MAILQTHLIIYVCVRECVCVCVCVCGGGGGGGVAHTCMRACVCVHCSAILGQSRSLHDLWIRLCLEQIIAYCIYRITGLSNESYLSAT